MTTVTLSQKFQIVIPKEIREELNMPSGLKLGIITYKNRIELIPIHPIKHLRGYMKGIDTKITREKDRI